MFTGIITDFGRVHRLRRGTGPEGGCELTIATAYPVDEIALGSSLSHSGPGLTVIAIEPGVFTVEASAETLARTTLGEWTEGTPVNLERALRLGDELGGHLVSGHVDGIAQLVERRPEGDSIRFTIEAPAELARYIAPKGSVALDGGSPTVNEVDGARLRGHTIPSQPAHPRP